MMDYRTLVILPTDSEAEAKKTLRELIYDHGVVLFIVLGRGKEDRQLCERASLVLGGDDSFCHVVWARRPDVVWTVIDGAVEDGTLPATPADLRAVCLNMSDQVQKTYPRSEAMPDALELITVVTEGLA
ncbi:MAG: hypothetical protein GY838_05620 [bacterium]|nr:hypothetical protein [bacterium]